MWDPEGVGIEEIAAGRAVGVCVACAPMGDPSSSEADAVKRAAVCTHGRHARAPAHHSRRSRSPLVTARRAEGRGS